MNIRITGQTQTANALGNLRSQQAALAKYQDQITSGIRLKAASDDPGAYAAAARTRSAGERYKVYQGTISDATAILNTSVSSLQDGAALLNRAKQIASQGIDPTLDATANEGLASEVDGLIDQLLRTANTQTESGYLFGGSNASTAPFRVSSTDALGNPTAIAYDGDTDRSQVLIGPNSQTADTQYVGSSVFQSSGGDAFAALIALRDDLRNPALTQTQRAASLTLRLGEVSVAGNQLGNTIGEQSGTLANLEGIQSRLVDLKLNADSRLTDLEATDYTEAVLKLKEQETAFESTLAVSAKLNRTSLLDYIR